MDDLAGSHQRLATDVTLDAPLTALNSHPPRERRVELVEGSGPEITGELSSNLKCRLRLASLVMFFGFTGFLIRNLIWPNELYSPAWLTFFHVLLVLTMAVSGFTLCHRCAVSMKTLRIREALIFGLPAVFFLILQYRTMTECAKYHYLPNWTGCWLLLIFTYAFFVPNNWRRAAGVIGTMAAAPVALTTTLFVTDQLCREAHNGGITYMTNEILSLFLGVGVALLGVATIRTLRYEAFEAKQLGRYRLKERIGSGGMGDVYLAEHQMMRRPCAIKVIQPSRAGDPRTMARFEREVHTIAKLSHWNSVDIYDYGRADDGTFYYVMEFLPGLSLQQLVDQTGPLSPERAIYLMSQTCDALNEAHGVGIIHRDIKPANIFAAERGGMYDVAKLLDFGLAKPMLDMESSNLSAEGVITGSPLYMPPEQAMGEGEPDARSDIYSLGGVMYFLLTGRPPFEGDRPLKVIFAHAQTPLIPPSQIRPDLPSDLEEVVMRCLSKHPDDRFQTARELSEALRNCRDADRWDRFDAQAWWHEFQGREPEAAEVSLVS